MKLFVKLTNIFLFSFFCSKALAIELVPYYSSNESYEQEKEQLPLFLCSSSQEDDLIAVCLQEEFVQYCFSELKSQLKASDIDLGLLSFKSSALHSFLNSSSMQDFEKRQSQLMRRRKKELSK